MRVVKVLRKGKRTFASQIIRFLVIFGIVWGGLHSLTIIFPRHLNSLCVFHASLTSGVITALGGSSQSSGMYVFFPKDTPAFTVIPECTGIFAAMVLVAAIIAFPAGVLAKSIGVGTGVLLIFALNLLRLLVMAVVIRYWPRYQEFLHQYFWQVTFIVFTVLIMKVWADWAGKVEKRTEVSG